jgi:hypothetical protein
MHIPGGRHHLIWDKVTAKYSQQHSPQQDRNRHDFFPKNNTGSGQDKKNTGNISHYDKTLMRRYQHVWEIMIIDGQKTQYGYSYAIENATCAS